MTRIIALDYGKRRIGIAISDPLQLIAQPLETLEHKNLVSTAKRLTELMRQYSGHVTSYDRVGSLLWQGPE